MRRPAGPFARIPDHPLGTQGRSAHRDQQDHVEKQMEGRPRASAQLEYARDRPTSAAAGMVVTEMDTPMGALDRASVSDTTPTIPPSRRHSEQVRIVDQTGDRPNPDQVQPRSVPGTADGETGDQGDDHGGGVDGIRADPGLDEFHTGAGLETPVSESSAWSRSSVRSGVLIVSPASGAGVPVCVTAAS